MELESALKRAAPAARVSTERPDLDTYARDLWPRGLVALQSGVEERQRPRAVVWPTSVDDVVGLVKLARSGEIALVPFGAGSGVCGAVTADAASVVVDMKRFGSWSVLPGPELDAGAGVLGITLEEGLLERGYTTGHYPSSILCSTVGGWAAARGAGQYSNRYGKIEDMVTSIEAVLGTGEVLRARTRAAGPNLVPLLVGSEGILGIITRVGLRLHAAPRARKFAAFRFDTMQAGIDAVRLLFQEGQRPAVARLYDPLDTWLLKDDEEAPRAKTPRSPRTETMRARLLRGVLRAPRLLAGALLAAEATLLGRAALILVHEGDETTVEREAEQTAELCLRARGMPLGEGPARAWFRHRYSVSYRQSPVFRSGAFSDTMEVSAPWSRIPQVYESVRRALGEHVLVMAHLSHAYPDGSSIYFTFAGTAHGGADALSVYDAAWRAALAAAIGAGASLSHHHGVGRSKAPQLSEELGAAVDVVRAVKRAWDPDGIMNPGALLVPSASTTREPRCAQPARHTGPVLDVTSCLVGVDGEARLGELEAWLAERGHTLNIAAEVLEHFRDMPLSAWLAAGMPGMRDRFADPVFAPLSGYTARLAGGRVIEQRAAPRRAVGPDLTPLFVGMQGRFGSIERATLVALRRSAPASASLPFSGERDAPLDQSEERALERLDAALLSGSVPV